MHDAADTTRFKIAAARGLLDAARIVALSTQFAAWLELALAAAWLRSGWASGVLACVSGGVAIGALWMLIRVAIDRRLFAALERAPVEDDALGALDRALLELRWIDASKAGRTIDLRVSGVAGLLRKTVALSIVQTLALIAAVLWQSH